MGYANDLFKSNCYLQEKEVEKVYQPHMAVKFNLKLIERQLLKV